MSGRQIDGLRGARICGESRDKVFDYCLFVPTNKQIYIYIVNYTTNAPTCFGASASSSGRFDIAFAKVIKH